MKIRQKQKEEFMNKQKKLDAPLFMPSNFKCWSCNQDIFDALIKKGNDGTELVTGCPLCARTYCD